MGSKYSHSNDFYEWFVGWHDYLDAYHSTENMVKFLKKEGLYGKAIAYRLLYFSGGYGTSILSFVWNMTEEGYGFWSHVSDKYDQYIRLILSKKPKNNRKEVYGDFNFTSNINSGRNAYNRLLANSTFGTFKLAQDVSAFHNIAAEAELTAILSEQIAAEIDRYPFRANIQLPNAYQHN